MTYLNQLTKKRRRLILQIEDAERHIDEIAIALEDLRRQRDETAGLIREHVMGLPIAQAVRELTDDILEAEVIV